MNCKLEYRVISGITGDVESRRVHGLAIATASRSGLLGDTFYETISPDAVNADLIANNDIRLLCDHSPVRGTLARSKRGVGSLKLTVSNRGLEFDAEMPKTPLGDEILEGIRRGDYDAMSFAFLPESVTWEENEDGTYERTINSFKTVEEISILSVAPAYESTEVALRSLDAFKNSNETDDMKKTTKRAKRDEEELKEDELEQKKKRDAESEDEEPKDEERTEDEEPKDDEERAEDEEPKDDEERAEGDEDEDDEDEERDCDEDEDGEPIEDRAMLKSYFKELRSQIA